MNLKEIDRAVTSYAKYAEPDDMVRLSFFKKLWEVIDNHTLSVDEMSYVLPSDKTIKKLHDNETPIFLEYAPKIHKDHFIKTLQALADVVVEDGSFEEEVNEFLKDGAFDELIDAKKLALAAKNTEEYLYNFAEYTLGKEILTESQVVVVTLLMSLALRAQMDEPARAIQDVFKKTNARYPHPLKCPVCGSKPALSFTRDDVHDGHARDLGCLQCGTLWEFERIRCARCGTQNQSDLHFFNIEGDDGHRIATCDNCGEYIRSVYAEGTPAPFALEVEDVMMIRLDVIAQNPEAATGGMS